jgi:hypothetical protein
LISEVNNKISFLIGFDGGLNYLFYTAIVLVILVLFTIIDKLIFTRTTK